MFMIVALSMLGYGIIHSWLASIGLKARIREQIGERKYHGLYRAGYNLFAIVSLSPVLGLMILRPGNTVWHVTGIYTIIFVLVQAMGLIGLLVSLFQIDLGQFIGLTQLNAYMNGDALPLPQEALQFEGIYRLVRHPLYLFSLLVLWPMSSMSESWLAFNIITTVYFVAGSILEERKLVATYGDVYRNYQRRTPALIPFLNILRQH